MRLVTSRQKKQVGAKFKNNFPFLKLINFIVIIVVRYQLKPPKCSFISTQEGIMTCHYALFDCAKFRSQLDQRLLV